MSGLDIFASIILACVVLSIMAVLVILGMLPGKIAHSRGHPNATAVTVAGWVTLLFGFVLWPLALIWAYVDFPQLAKTSDEIDELRRRTTALENELSKRQAAS